MQNVRKIMEDFSVEYNYAVMPFNFTLQYDLNKLQDNIDKLGFFNSLDRYSDIAQGFQASSEFDFSFDQAQKDKKFRIFGTDHGECDYAVDNTNGKIALLETVSGNFFFHVAKDELSFMQVLTTMISFGNNYSKGVKVDGNLTRKSRQACILLAGGNDYAKLYQNIIISEEDMPEEPFTLP